MIKLPVLLQKLDAIVRRKIYRFTSDAIIQENAYEASFQYKYMWIFLLTKKIGSVERIWYLLLLPSLYKPYLKKA